MAVAARADVALRVERLAAQRARRPASRHHALGLTGERSRVTGVDANPDQIGTIRIVVLVLVCFLSLVVELRVARLDDDHPGLGVPTDGERARPEDLVERLIERTRVLVATRRSHEVAALELVEERPQSFSKRSHLDLLERHAHGPTAIARLEVEHALSRLTDGAGGEAVGPVEQEEAAGHFAGAVLAWLGLRLYTGSACWSPVRYREHMRAMVLREPADIGDAPLRLAGIADPSPGPGELLLRLAACGVCRTDLQLVEGDIPSRRLPIVPGHQAVGQVVAVGSDVTGWEIGDRAGVAWLGGSCGVCRWCRDGRENLCPSAVFTGWDRDGGYAELLTARADFSFPLPDGFADLAAAPLLCGGVIGYRALRVSGITPGGRLGLFGFGASALISIQVARHWGCEVYVVTRSHAERERALSLGAAWAGGYADTVPVPLDAAVTFAPVGEVVVAALEAVDRGGTVAINAIHLDRIPTFSYDLLWLERSLRSVANFTRQDARELLELAVTIPIRTETDVFPLAEANRALGRLSSGEVRGAAVLAIDGGR